MEKWICKVCGYTHLGDEAPARCPQCGAPKSQFRLQASSAWNAFSAFFVITLIAAVFSLVMSCSSTSTVDNSTVSDLDLTKYLGRWYEIARYDHSFERGMKMCTANYTLLDNGEIKVTNQGEKNGKWKRSIGKAKTTSEPGVLRVSFFGPFYSDYRILMLAPDYSYALIGSNSDSYLWILSRTPQLKRSTRDKILHEIKRRGYDATALIWDDYYNI